MWSPLVAYPLCAQVEGGLHTGETDSSRTAGLHGETCDRIYSKYTRREGFLRITWLVANSRNWPKHFGRLRDMPNIALMLTTRTEKAMLLEKFG